MPLIANRFSQIAFRKSSIVENKKRIIFLVGPTAAGKTTIAVHLAKYLNAEIISCDSMQIYRGMDILTSKPSAALRKRIPYHLIDFVQPHREYDVCRYRRQALAKIKGLFKKGKTPLLVGGTGLYVSVLVDGIFEAVPIKKSLRQGLYRQAVTKGNAYLYARLKKVDPEAACRIHPNDTKRMVRALEVFGETGEPISKLQKERRGLGLEYDIRIFCLDMLRRELYRRIDKRVEMMFKRGLVKEVDKLLESKLSRTAGFAIGLREIKGYLEGRYGLAEARRLMQRNTRWYAKRQLSWWRRDKRIKWIKVRDKQGASVVARRILRELR